MNKCKQLPWWIKCAGNQNEELTTAAEAAEISELHAEIDAFIPNFLVDSDLESEDEY